MGLTIAVIITAALFGWTGFVIGYCIGREHGQGTKSNRKNKDSE